MTNVRIRQIASRRKSGRVRTIKSVNNKKERQDWENSFTSIKLNRESRESTRNVMQTMANSNDNFILISIDQGGGKGVGGRGWKKINYFCIVTINAYAKTCPSAITDDISMLFGLFFGRLNDRYETGKCGIKKSRYCRENNGKSVNS